MALGTWHLALGIGIGKYDNVQSVPKANPQYTDIKKPLVAQRFFWFSESC
ncbi:hypothetical protein VS_0603 [Vibrio atlanticus]|uniref:Uncharacterized protein n=1 Tax=Vibrio atlanticus (strain LGP32) TaxID=575788 RepID=B7VJS2_VIBA3|nr:hypothetical protein VS_0603 [Vibrio atlanticus]